MLLFSRVCVSRRITHAYYFFIIVINRRYFDKSIFISRQILNNKQLSDPISDTKVFRLGLSRTSLLLRVFNADRMDDV